LLLPSPSSDDHVATHNTFDKLFLILFSLLPSSSSTIYKWSRSFHWNYYSLIQNEISHSYYCSSTLFKGYFCSKNPKNSWLQRLQYYWYLLMIHSLIYKYTFKLLIHFCQKIQQTLLLTLMARSKPTPFLFLAKASLTYP